MKRVARLLVVVASMVLLASCWCNSHGYFAEDATPLARARFAQIADAVNSKDAAALLGVFTEYALAEHSAEIDAGVERLLALFPDGDLVSQEERHIPAVEYRRIDDDHRTILSGSLYRVRSGGNYYHLFFADLTVNMIDPENVGVYALGVAPRTESSWSGPERAFYSWMDQFDIDPSAPPGIYIPEYWKREGARVELIRPCHR